jgi:hypothetical protein
LSQVKDDENNIVNEKATVPLTFSQQDTVSSFVPPFSQNRPLEENIGEGETRLWQEKRLFTWIRQCDRRSRFQKSGEVLSLQVEKKEIFVDNNANNDEEVNENSIKAVESTSIPLSDVSNSRGNSSSLYSSSLLFHSRMKTALEKTATVTQTLEISLLGAWALPSLSSSSSSTSFSNSGSNDASSAFSLSPSSSVYCSFSIWGENCDSQKYKSRLVHSAHVKSASEIGSISEGFSLTSGPVPAFSCPAPFWNETFQFTLTKADVAMLYISVHEAPLSAIGGATMMTTAATTTTSNATIVGGSGGGGGGGAHSTSFIDSDESSFLAYFAAPVSCLRGGYRCLPLRDAKGKKLGALSTLLCRFRFI